MFVYTFYSSKLTDRNWSMPSIANFMESLTQEQDNLVKMGTIKSSKDQAFAAGVLNLAKGKKKAREE